MREQHAVHRSLKSHFKILYAVQVISASEARTTSWPGGKQSVLLEWIAGQAPKQQLLHRSTRTHHRRFPPPPPPQEPYQKDKGDATKKMAGPSKGSCQWRSVGGGLLSCIAQQWQNLLGECRSSSGVLLKWECHQPPLTRTLIQFPTRNKKKELQKAVESLLKKGPIEPILRSCFLEFFSRLCLAPRKPEIFFRYRPVHSEQTSVGTPFSDGDCADSQGCNPSGRVDSVYRHQGCLSTYRWANLWESFSGSVSTRRHISSRVYCSGQQLCPESSPSSCVLNAFLDPGLYDSTPDKDVYQSSIHHQPLASEIEIHPASREMLDRRWANVVTYVGTTSANDVGPTWICPSVQRWHNVLTPPTVTLRQRFANVITYCILLYLMVSTTFAQCLYEWLAKRWHNFHYRPLLVDD